MKNDGITPVKFYAESRNLNFRNKLSDATSLVNTFTKFYSGTKDPKTKEDVSYETRTYDVNGKSEKYKILEPLRGTKKSDDEGEFAAISPEGEPVVVLVKRQKNGYSIVDVPIEEIKTNAVNNALFNK
jgi:hypothetical protein